jgi:hypothetical protein
MWETQYHKQLQFKWMVAILPVYGNGHAHWMVALLLLVVVFSSDWLR